LAAASKIAPASRIKPQFGHLSGSLGTIGFHDDFLVHPVRNQDYYIVALAPCANRLRMDPCQAKSFLLSHNLCVLCKQSISANKPTLTC
jgi:hypothetical protein